MYYVIPVTFCLTDYTLSGDYKTATLHGTVRVDRSPFSVKILSANAWVSTSTQYMLGTGTLQRLPVTVTPNTDVDISAVLQTAFTPEELSRLGGEAQYIRVQASARYCIPISFWAWSACEPMSWNYDESYTPAQLAQLANQA